MLGAQEQTRRLPRFAFKMPPPGENPAVAFAKGGDSEEHLEVSLFRLHVYNILIANSYLSSNVTEY